MSPAQNAPPPPDTLPHAVLCCAALLPPQGALIAMALVLIEQPPAKAKALRERIDKLYGNKGAEVGVGGRGWVWVGGWCW